MRQFIEKNIHLIQNQRWEEIYEKDFPDGFTEILLNCGINPLEQDLNYIPNHFLCDCKRIKKFIIPNNVTSIGEQAFGYCDSLTSIVIPNSVTSIGDYAFYYCYSLTSIEIPSKVTNIGESAFSGCSSLTNIVIPDNVTSIGGNAFYNCRSLTSITMGNGVKNIAKCVFAYCDNLTSINYNGTKEEWDAINKHEDWAYNVNVIVYCTDGEINYNE